MRKWISLPSPKEDTSTIYALENDAFDYTTFIKTILKSSADSEDILAQNPLQNAMLHSRGVVQEIQETVTPQRLCPHLEEGTKELRPQLGGPSFGVWRAGTAWPPGPLHPPHHLPLLRQPLLLKVQAQEGHQLLYWVPCPRLLKREWRA